MRLSASLGLTDRRSGVAASFSVTITGLTSGEARPGDHASISYTTDPVSATETVKWSNSSNPADVATYGTGASPTDYTAGDGGNLWLHVTDNGETVSRSAPIRYAAGTAPAVADGQSFTVDTAITTIDASASGANLTFSYSATGLASGLSINASTGAITGTPDTAESATTTVTATDQYGRTLQDTFTFTASLRTQATAADGLGPFNWTVDDTSVSVDATTDFTANGNTLTYTATGLPAGVTIASNGIINGTPTVTDSGPIVVTGQDEYGRETTSSFNYSTSLRSQATATDFSAQNFTVDDEAMAINFVPQFTANGNTLTYEISFLPAGVSDDGDGTTSGTPTEAINGTAVCTATDEYGRETDCSAPYSTVDTDDQSGTITISAVDEYGRTPVASAFSYTTDEFSLSETVDSELEIGGATGTVTVTITSPSWYANYDAGNGPGVFTFDSALLASGPVNIIPPLIERTNDADSSGTTNEGDTVGIGDPASSTSYPGLWVYDPDVGGLGTASYQWQADAGGDGTFANLSGATSSAYTLTSGEAGDDVRVQETLADNGGSRTASSVAVSVDAGTATINSITGTTGGAIIDYTGTLTITGTTGGADAEAA